VQFSSLLPDIELFKNSYCQITSLITVVHKLFDTIDMNFLCDNNEESSTYLLNVENS
jgi:hypothetical protein